MRHLCLSAALLALAAPAAAAPVSYLFSGTIDNLFQDSNGSTGPFALGQRFTGTVVYDFDAISFGYDAIVTPDWTMAYRNTPLVALSYSVDTGGGTYAYTVPTQNLSSAAWQYAAVAQGTGGWNGIELRTHNYPIGWTANPPSMPVPPSAYIGAYNPHSAYLTISKYGDTSVLADRSGNLDLGSLFAATGDGRFSVRFSDSSKWLTGMERVDIAFAGALNSVTRVSAAVPEPQTWAMLIAGFGLVGAAARRRRSLQA
jgi:PEP-CTERM motif